MSRVDREVLAWGMADAAAVALKPFDRARLCAKIGAGEHDSAIRSLLGFYANSRVELPLELAAPLRSWIRGYAGSDSEPVLWDSYKRIVVSSVNAAVARQSDAAAARSPRQLVAKRSEQAKRVKNVQYPLAAESTVVTRGITTSIEQLLLSAVHARRAAHTAIEVAVREARSANWSWKKISAALGGTPDAESLRRRFGATGLHHDGGLDSYEQTGQRLSAP